MAGRYPKPDGQKVHRGKPAFAWVNLPREGQKAPSLPTWRKWNSATRKWWRELWQKPQSSMWDPTGTTLWTLATLYDDLFSGNATGGTSGEIRQHEDRHGLNPKAMLQLRWRFTAAEMDAMEDAAIEEPAAAAVPKDSVEARRERLKIVG